MASTLLALEARYMFDAAAVATGAEVLAADTAAQQADAALGAAAHLSADAAPAAEREAPAPAAFDASAPADVGANDNTLASALDALPAAFPSTVGSGERTEVVFVDRNVPELDTLLAGIDPAAEVVLIDSGRDGLQQVADALQGRSGIDAIHILSHGEPGELRLGNASYDSGNIDDHAATLQAIGATLSADGDLLLYGCDLGQGDDGRQLLAALGTLTGADVAASDDVTGAAAAGGDWVLEQQVGTVETQVAVTAAGQRAFGGVLLVAPEGTDNVLSATAGTPVVITPGAFGFTDPAEVGGANNFQSVRIGAQSADGTLQLSGANVAPGQVIPVAEIAAGNLTYTATTPGTTPNFAFHVMDDGGGAFEDLTPNILGFNVAANQPPVTTLPASFDARPGTASGLRGLSIADADAGNNLITLTFSVPAGTGEFETLLVPNIGVAGNNTNTLTLTGTLANLNAYLVNSPPAFDGNGSAINVPLTVQTSDGTATTTANANIVVNAPPVVDASGNSAGRYAGGWFYNIDPSTPRDQDAIRPDAPAGNYTAGRDTNIIASASDQTDGAGVTSTVPGTALSISGVGTGDLSSAIANNDYVEFGFTTPAGLNPTTVLDRLGHETPMGSLGGYSFSAAISSDGFASSQMLVTDVPVQPSPSAYVYYVVPVTEVPLAASTTYTIRIYMHSRTLNAASDPSGASTEVIFDDFQFSTAVDPVDHFTDYTEDGTPVPVVAPNFTVDDANSPNMQAATVTLGNPQAGDVLSLGGTRLVAGASGTVPGSTITYTVTTDASGAIALNFSGNASRADYAAAIRSVTLSTTSDTPNTTVTREVTITANDGIATSAPARTFITVRPANDPPTVPPAAENVDEDTPRSGNVLTGSSDPEGDTVRITQFEINGTTVTAGTAAVIPNVGSLTINADGSYLFTPAPHYTGAIPVATFTASDGAATVTNTLTLTMQPVPDAPVAQADAVTTPEDTPATGNVLTNDSDPDGDTLSVTQFEIGGTTYPAGSTATLPGVGTLLINADGSYTFTPAPNYSGAVPTATYTVSDGIGTPTTTSTLAVTITPVNDPPVPVADSATTPEDTQATGNVLGNDTDPDSDPLSVTEFVVNGSTFAAGTTATLPGVGTLRIDANGSYTFDPAPNFNGAVPVATYTVSDGTATATSTLTLNVTGANDSPVAQPDAVTTPEDTPATGNVLSNDSDPDGNPLSVTQFEIGGSTFPAGSMATLPGIGTLLINADGSYTFTPEPNYDGAVPTATYTVSDGTATTTSTLDVTITPVDDAPAAQADTASTAPGTPAAGNVLGNDTDAENNPLTVTQFEVNGSTVPAGTPVDLPGVGRLTINPDGSFAFDPAPGFSGPVPVATYTVSDGTNTVPATLTLTVSNPPTAQPDSATTPEDTPETGNVLGNDTDPEGDALTVTQFEIGGSTVPAGTPVDLPGVGRLTIDPDGSYRFEPAPDYSGPVPTATYTVSDGTSTVPGTLALAITPVNDAPTPQPDSASVPQGTPATGNVLGNDTDPDRDPLTVTQFEVNGTTLPAGGTADLPGVGQLTVNADGSYLFTPAPGFTGPVPVATYTVSDGSTTAPATLALTITPAIAALPDAVSTAEDTPVSGNVLANDSDPEGDQLTVTQFEVGGITLPTGGTAELPGVGTLTLRADGSFVFTPAPDYNGPVPTASYTVTDGSSTATGTLALSITPVNDPPTPQANAVVTPENTPATGNVLTNDSDPDGDALTVTQFEVDGITVPAGGTADLPGIGQLTIHADGSYTFTPAPDYSGPVPLASYTVSDGSATATGSLALSVGPSNSPPVTQADSMRIPEDTPATGNVLANDADAEGDPLSVTQFEVGGITVPAGGTASLPGVGTLTIQADGRFVFTPAPDYNGPVPLATYTVSDGTSTRTGTLAIAITPVADVPRAVNDVFSTAEDTPVNVPVLLNDSDPDGDALRVVRVNGVLLAVGAVLPVEGGLLRLNADNSFTFTPAAGFRGAATFGYSVTDPGGATAQALVLGYVGRAADVQALLSAGRDEPGLPPPTRPLAELPIDVRPAILDAVHGVRPLQGLATLDVREPLLLAVNHVRSLAGVADLDVPAPILDTVEYIQRRWHIIDGTEALFGREADGELIEALSPGQNLVLPDAAEPAAPAAAPLFSQQVARQAQAHARPLHDSPENIDGLAALLAHPARAFAIGVSPDFAAESANNATPAPGLSPAAMLHHPHAGASSARS